MLHQTSQSGQGSQAVPANAPVRPDALARALYGKLRAEGLTEGDMMALVGELMGLVTAEMRGKLSGG